MSGCDYTNDPKYPYKVGDPCWIFVDNVNTPTGRWKGEIVAVEITGNAPYESQSPRAKITDPRIKEDAPPGSPLGAAYYFDKEPTVNYRVLPSTPHTDKLIAMVTKLETERDAIQFRAGVRERALFDALTAITEGRSEKAAKEAFERGVEHARAEAKKAAEKKPT